MKRDSLKWIISGLILSMFCACEDELPLGELDHQDTLTDDLGVDRPDALTSFDSGGDQDLDQDLDQQFQPRVDSEIDADHLVTPSSSAHLETRRYEVGVSIHYMDRVYDASGFDGEYVDRAVPFVEVQLILEDPYHNDRVVARAYTDHEGEARLVWVWRDRSPDLISADGLGLRVRALSSQRTPRGDHAQVTSRRRGVRYALESNPIPLKAFGKAPQVPSLGMATYRAPHQRLTASAEARLSGAFNILTMTALGFELIERYTDQIGPPLKIQWDLDLPVACGSCYVGDEILLGGQVEDPDHYDDHIILHEVGHFFAHRWSVDTSPGGPHRGRSVTPPLAYGEGLAYFWSALALDDPLIVDWMFPTPWVVDIERGIYNGMSIIVGLGEAYPSTGTLDEVSYHHHEELVSSLMWDIYDEPEDDEALHVGEETMMSSLLFALPERYRSGLDIGARGIDLADWLDALSCVSLRVDDSQSEANAEVLIALERAATQLGYPWSRPGHSDDREAGDEMGDGHRPGEIEGERVGEDAGVEERSGGAAQEVTGARCSLKGSLPRPIVFELKSGQLWFTLAPNDPLLTEQSLSSDIKSLGGYIRRWRGRPPHVVELEPVVCPSLPCLISAVERSVMIFEFTLGPSDDLVDPERSRRVTSWIPRQVDQTSASSQRQQRRSRVRETFVLERAASPQGPSSP